MSKLLNNLSSQKLSAMKERVANGEYDPKSIRESLVSIKEYVSGLIPVQEMLIEVKEKELRVLNKKLKKLEKQQNVIQRISCCCTKMEAGDHTLDWERELKSLIEKYFIEDEKSEEDDE